MDTAYQRVKANSKFFKILEQYNLSSQPTATGAALGSQPASLDTSVAGQTGQIDPKVVALQKASQQKMQKAQADAAKAELAALQATQKTLPQQQTAVAKRIKELQQAVRNVGKPTL